MSIASRKDIADRDKWNLSKLCSGHDEWKQAIQALSPRAEALACYKGSLGKSPKHFIAFWNELRSFKIESERLGSYAFLCHAADGSDPENQELKAIHTKEASEHEALLSWIEPEIIALDEAFIAEVFELPEAKDAKIAIQKMRALAAHVLSAEEEQILALHQGVRSLAQEAYSALCNSDMDMGVIRDEDGVEQALSAASFPKFMQSPDPELRKTAYNQAYSAYDAHKHTLATLIGGAVKSCYVASKSRNYTSSLEAALAPDQVPAAIYSTLLQTLEEGLPALHEYYDLKRQVLGLDEISHWDVYTPLVRDAACSYSYEEAVELIRAALAPMGESYTDTLCAGLLGGWVDRYENKGKRSGAFSAGSYTGEPYILMSYKEGVIRSLFTLAHEGGHSMHSYYSVRSNPFDHYRYTIFEAEVASTFNEKLLTDHMLKTCTDKSVRAFILNKEMDDIVATLFRQAMFAEFEYLIHKAYQEGTALTLSYLRSTYGRLLKKYFGPQLVFNELSDLEFFRIPHFYRPFYVYKYATGISASIALSRKVLDGEAGALDAYYGFLRSGGSRYPLDNLRTHGVDMLSAQPIRGAIAYFESLMETYKKEMIS